MWKTHRDGDEYARCAADPFYYVERYVHIECPEAQTLLQPCRLWPAQRPALTRALKEHHIPYKEVIYRRATHGVGTGINTDADGWINDAVAFWEEQTA